MTSLSSSEPWRKAPVKSRLEIFHPLLAATLRKHLKLGLEAVGESTERFRVNYALLPLLIYENIGH